VYRLRKNCSSFSTCTLNDHLLRVTIPDAVLTHWGRGIYIVKTPVPGVYTARSKRGK
jgi:hypothetical protein